MKYVVITGGTRGIGFGLAKHFLKEGCTVIICGKNEGNLFSAIEELKKVNPKAKVFGTVCDTRELQALEELLSFSLSHVPHVDIWINNAGIDQKRKYVWEMTEDEYTDVIETNVIGVIHGSKVALNHMKKQGFGQIYNMQGFGSDGMMMKQMTLYGTSKRAVAYFTESLAKEAKDLNIQIGRISPGMVVTDLLLNSLKENPEEAAKYKKVFNILSDHVDTVTPYIVKSILNNKKNNHHIRWLKKSKAAYRFMTSSIIKRKLID